MAEGSSDADLDRIDISEGLDVGDPTWSLGQAEELLPLLVPASWAVLTNDLIGTASDALPRVQGAVLNNPALSPAALAALHVSLFPRIHERLAERVNA